MGKRNELIWICFYYPLFVLILLSQPSQSFTDERDVSAINSLYTSLGSPALTGWTAKGGDPCSEGWQGVKCVFSNITAITLNAANLSGELGDNLGKFLYIISVDLSNNNIGGSISENLPVTVQELHLSANKLTGRIPASLSNLTNLFNLSLNGNNLNGQLPDSFQSLTSLTNMDISCNNLSGPLPPSMKSLSSLTTFHTQQNHLTGVLDVLRDLPLQDLNIENNSFSGPIPKKLFSIPNFKKNGNPFNTSIIISPPSQPPSLAPDPLFFQEAGPPESHTTLKILLLLGLITLFLVSIYRLKRDRREELEGYFAAERVKNWIERFKVRNRLEKAAQEQVVKNQKVIFNPIGPIILSCEITEPSTSAMTSAKSFSFADVLKYTDSFNEDNLIRQSWLGRVYLARLPNGDLLEVMQIDNITIPHDEFLELVHNLSQLRDPNVQELVGYCMEFDQRLLVYSHFSTKTLQDLLYGKGDERKSLSWNIRMEIALGAAKGLEYLHQRHGKETIVHQHFEPYNILLDNSLSVQIAECGLASLMSVNSQINESGSSYKEESDVYSFGVVMLQLLTGRTTYDMRPSGAQHLVSWAIPQLDDMYALCRMVDPAIQGQCSDKSLSHFADIISRCLEQDPVFRPPMSEIVEDLTSMVGHSRVF